MVISDGEPEEDEEQISQIVTIRVRLPGKDANSHDSMRSYEQLNSKNIVDLVGFAAITNYQVLDGNFAVKYPSIDEERTKGLDEVAKDS